MYADLVRCLEDGADPTAGALLTRAGLASGGFGENEQNIQWVKCDASQANEVESAVQQVLDRYGRIDVLVNNCGICPDASCVPAHELPVEIYDKVTLSLSSRTHASPHTGDEQQSARTRSSGRGCAAAAEC